MKESFTLIELIVVIAIIAILAAIIAPNAFKAIEKAKISKTIADLKTIKTACQSLYADTGKWPYAGASHITVANSHLLKNPAPTWDGVDEDRSGWDGPYLDDGNTMHPWGATYHFGTHNNFNPADGGTYDFFLLAEDYCQPSGPTAKCAIPYSAAEKIDQVLDDGTNTTGTFRFHNYPPALDAWWLMQWDFCEHTETSWGVPHCDW